MVTVHETLEIFRGDTKVFPFKLTDDSAVAKDLTGWLLWFTVKKSLRDADSGALFQRIIDAGITVLNQTTRKGEIEVKVEPANTTGLLNTYHNLHYDLQSKDPAGNLRTERAGMFLVLPSVTESTIYG